MFPVWGGWCIYFFFPPQQLQFYNCLQKLLEQLVDCVQMHGIGFLADLYKPEFAVALGIGSQYACVQSQLIQVAIFCCEQTSLVVRALRHKYSCGGTTALLAI